MTMLAHVFVLALFGASALSLKWTMVHDGTGTAPSPRRDPAIGYDAGNNVLILYGGRDNDKVHLNDTWIYDIAKGEWSELTLTSAPSPRRSVVYASDAGGFYVATGEMKGKQANDAWLFDFGTRTWSQLDQRPCEADGPVPEPRYGAAGGIYPGSKRLLVSLGFGKLRYFDTFVYKLDKKCWQIVTPGPHNVYNPSYPHARCLHGGAVTGDDQLVIFGGCMSGGGVGGPCPAGDAWQLTKDTGRDDMSWERVESCPIPRIYPTMAALPSDVQKAVLYGGVENSGQVLQTQDIPANELGIFDSASKTWTLKQTEGDVSPPRRASAVMVTVADGIYMFGGVPREGKGHLNDLWKLTGTVDASKTVDSCNRPFFNLIIVHGILMFLAWGLLLQAGAFIARYFRDKGGRWFKAHLALQIVGLLAGIGGLVCAILTVGSGHFQLVHGVIGIIVMVTGILQPINAVIRPHIKEDGIRTTRRKVWEFFHKNLGRLALILGLVNVTLGLFIGVIRDSVWIAWCVYLAVVVVAYAVFEIRNLLQQNKQKEKISQSENKPI